MQSMSNSPILKWTGSKFNQPNVLAVARRLYKPYKDSLTLVEPFVGGLGLTHALNPIRAILNDSNPCLIDFYQAIKDGHKFNDFYLELLNEHGYSRLREILNKHMLEKRLSDPDFMTVFYLINKSCFNGLWRVNSKGKYNVPTGRNSKGEVYTPEFPDLTPYFKQFQTWKFKSKDYDNFIAIVTDCEPNSILFIDPPYDKITGKESFTGYTKDGFTWEDQKFLANRLYKLNCPVIACNAATPRVIELYSDLGFNIEVVTARRSISGQAKEIVASLNCKN